MGEFLIVALGLYCFGVGFLMLLEKLKEKFWRKSNG